jgi:integrase
MTMDNSTSVPVHRKPRKKTRWQDAKPHKDFPLTAHPSGRWCKKVRGKVHFFGKITLNDNGASAQAALERWLAEKDNLLAGRVPRSRQPSRQPGDGIELRELVNRFMTTKTNQLGKRDAAAILERHTKGKENLPQGLVELLQSIAESKHDRGDLSRFTWKEYHAMCRHLITTFGRDRLISDILPEDFERLRAEWAKSWGPTRLAAEIVRARTVFNYAWKQGMVTVPIRFGEGFRPPSKKALRLNRAEQGVKMFEADELRRMLDNSAQSLRAMILLAINAGLGNNDIGLLRMKHLDLDAGWLNYPRPKTGMNRRCPLWAETISAVKEWLTIRPAPAKETDGDLVFITMRGKRGWTADLHDKPLTKEIRKLLDRLRIEGQRNFYCIRHTFETIAGNSRDQVAVDAIMGHDNGSMANQYRERIDDARLKAVTEHVHAWLFARDKPQLRLSDLGQGT